MSPISESLNHQTENTLTAPNIPEHNDPPIVMASTHPRNLIGNKCPEVVITDHNVQPKLKSQAGFVRNSVLLCPRIYLNHNEVKRDDLME